MYYGVRAPDGSLVYPVAPAGYESRWICGEDRYKQLAAQGLIEWQQVKQNGELRWQVYQKFYLDGRQKQPSNLWSGIEGNKKATRDLKALFDGRKVFSFPKPVGLIQRVIQVAARDPQAIVLDFFAGSGTTAHALMQQNADDQGARRYIMVQLPEPLESSSRDQAEAAAFCDDHGLRRNIAELTKERLRRAGTKVKHENPMFAGDTGFRVFKLDSSNILEWQPNRDDLKESLAEHIEHLKADRSEQDILYELLLKRGLDLCVPIETKEIAGKQVHSIGAGSLFACLAESISRDEGEDLALGIVAWHKELDPAGDTAIVFRDDAFSDDVVKTNVAAILEQNDLKNVRSL